MGKETPEWNVDVMDRGRRTGGRLGKADGGRLETEQSNNRSTRLRALVRNKAREVVEEDTLEQTLNNFGQLEVARASCW